MVGICSIVTFQMEAMVAELVLNDPGSEWIINSAYWEAKEQDYAIPVKVWCRP
jgi:hypothetical protein